MERSRGKHQISWIASEKRDSSQTHIESQPITQTSLRSPASAIRLALTTISHTCNVVSKAERGKKAKSQRWGADVQRTKGSEVVLLQPVLDVLAVDQRLGRKVPPCPEEREGRAAGELERVRLPDLQ